MNIQKVGSDKFYFEVALRQSEKLIVKKLPKDKIRKLKSLNIEKIKCFSKTLRGNLMVIEKTFPSVENLDPFYIELIENNIGIAKLKNEIGKVKGTVKLIHKLENESIKKIRTTKKTDNITKEKRSFLGRAGSALKKIRKDLESLENIRQKLREFPSIKTNIKTVCIAGYPNVGKSTLLRKITTAKPDVNVYPFTTKGLMLGYIGKELQVIDTPGTFGDKKTMNKIERQAYLAIKHLANLIIFVIDFTESCGYSLELQKEVLKRLKEEFKDKKIIIYGSKSDLMSEKDLKKYSQKNVFFDAAELKKFLLQK